MPRPPAFDVRTAEIDVKTAGTEKKPSPGEKAFLRNLSPLLLGVGHSLRLGWRRATSLVRGRQEIVPRNFCV